MTLQIRWSLQAANPARCLVPSTCKLAVLGVYASAVHARWIGSNGSTLVGALAVASEPVIFWDGSDAEAIVAGLSIPPQAGRLEPAVSQFNGPSGRSLDSDFLRPLGLDRSQAWLCDLVPHTCLNASQGAALRRAYEPRLVQCGLPTVRLPPVPTTFDDAIRCEQIAAEIAEARPEVVVLLGDKPIAHFLRRFDRRWKRLSDFGHDAEHYGRRHRVSIAGTPCDVLPLAHPRQVSALGKHSPRWRALHQQWKQRVTDAIQTCSS